MKQLHNFQITILKKLLFNRSLNFSDLLEDEMENSYLNFHLNRLLNKNYVEKKNGTYQLTLAGKEYANRIQVTSDQIENQAKVTTVICAVKNTKKHKEYLIYKRLKHPFFGCFGFPTQKVKWGESIYKAAQRGLTEETGLIGEGKLFAIRHYKVLSKEEKILEDKLMHAFVFENPKGKLSGNNEGKFYWVRENEISKVIKKPLVEFFEIYNVLKNNTKKDIFKELEVHTKYF